MSKKLRLGCKLLLLVCLLVPVVILAHEPSFSPGNPCHAESTLYYSDTTYTTVVGWQRIHLLRRGTASGVSGRPIPSTRTTSGAVGIVFLQTLLTPAYAPRPIESTKEGAVN